MTTMMTTMINRPAHADVFVVSGDDVALMNVIGEIDIASVARVRYALEELLDTGVTRVVVDLSDAAFVDSTGLSALVAGRRRMAARGIELVLRRPSPSLDRLLTALLLDRTFVVER